MSRSQINRPEAPPAWATTTPGCPVLHVDMDAFFASVEVARQPGAARAADDRRRDGQSRGGPGRHLRGAPVRHPLGDAHEPGVAAGPAGPGRRAARTTRTTRHVSAAVMEVFTADHPGWSRSSLDEAFLDVSGCRLTHGSPGADRRDDPRPGARRAGHHLLGRRRPHEVRRQAGLHPVQARRSAGRPGRPGDLLPAPDARRRAVGGGGAHRGAAAPARPAHRGRHRHTPRRRP